LFCLITKINNMKATRLNKKGKTLNGKERQAGQARQAM
jgi:hypothetical protein